MNIQLLLSGAQSQGASSVTKQTLYSTLESSQGAFRQALSQAANAPSNASQTHQTSDPAAITAQPLQALGFEFSEQSLASLLSGESYAGEGLTPLDEIAARMDLVALFAEIPAADAQLEKTPTLETLIQQLNLGEDQVAELLGALGIRHQADQASGLTESLASLSEEHADQLISALSILLAAPQNSVALQTSAAPTQLMNSQSAFNQGPPPLLHATPAGSPNQTTAPVNGQEFLTQLGALAPATQADSQAMLSVLEDRDPSLRASPIATALSGHTALGNTSSIAAPGVPTAQASIGTSVNSPAWPAQLGQQLVQFAQRGGEQQVKMQLHPAELGPLSITLKVSEQGTQAHFLASHMQVRQVIEQAIPQLREALAEQGISLGETSVGEQHSSNEQAFAQNGNSATSNGSGGVSEADSDSVTPAAENHSITLDGRVDLYA
ncbi:flagellar hook-length control protein FliK [Halomonas sp. AOP43-A1-21]|uniref:flagellar hook-length control protein FliK n=1 Tax=Halomonas colorata TaxID=2742615 RepID=UPI001D0303C1|nr:flagellar hook-length control protein FliK [Halomonas colorata]